MDLAVVLAPHTTVCPSRSQKGEIIVSEGAGRWEMVAILVVLGAVVVFGALGALFCHCCRHGQARSSTLSVLLACSGLPAGKAGGTDRADRWATGHGGAWAASKGAGARTPSAVCARVSVIGRRLLYFFL